jgi:Short repeat of unknown function (DUF308)
VALQTCTDVVGPERRSCYRQRAVFLIGGFYLLTHPLLAIGTVTVLLAAVIFAEGVFDIITYFRLQREHPSGWMLLNGIVALVLGGLIWAQWPSSSTWAIGTLVGVNPLMTGITRLMFWTGRTQAHQAPDRVTVRRQTRALPVRSAGVPPDLQSSDPGNPGHGSASALGTNLRALDSTGRNQGHYGERQGRLRDGSVILLSA